MSTISLLPYSLLDVLGAVIGGLGYRFYHKYRRVACMNIDWCFPELSSTNRDRLLRAHFVAAARCVLMQPILWWGVREKLVARMVFENREALDTAIAAGPVIVLSCHSLMLDFGAAGIAWRYSAVSMYRRFKNPLDEWLMLRTRARFNNHLVARGDSLHQLIRLTRAGTVCYHMPDEDLGAQDAIFAPFFGRPKATLNGISRMARITRASVVPCYPHYLGKGRFALRFLPALHGYPEADEGRNANQINSVLETLIRTDPTQYLWKMRLFRTRESDAVNPYR